MFQYDNTLLADTIWADYVQIVKENIQLRAQLEVAKKVVESLQVQLADTITTPHDELSEHSHAVNPTLPPKQDG